MTIAEQSRHELHQRLERVLGPEEATTLMEHLPPTGWRDVATKQDLDHVAERLELRFDTKLSDAIAAQTRFLAIANIGSIVAFGSLILAAAKL
jgi:hypothetical protein